MEDCRFETSEIQASLLMSTQLFTDSWSSCNTANCDGRIKIQLIAGITYVAIQAVPMIQLGDLVGLPVAGDVLFPGLSSDEPLPMVDAAILKLFFQLKIKEVLELELVGRKLVVITGHSTGGAVAALTALWLLSQTSLPPFRVFCITFGSPLLGNQSLSTSISRSRLAHNFCHVVSIHDLVPRSSNEQFWPFGTYLFCSDNGGVCLDNADSVRRMFNILNATGTPNIEEHQRYGHYVFTLSHMFLKSRSFLGGNIPDNSYQAGVALAVEALGFSNDDTSGVLVKECIETTTRIVRAPILRSAELANDLASVLPARLEIQWYKDRCDASEEQLGYYDFFKRYSLKRDYKVNMSRKRLAQFWDKVVKMVETNELPFDFHLGKKWVYASQFYQLLTEPLDIANFYKNRDIKSGGHYLDQGNRPKRYEVIDQWQKGVAKPDKCERSIYTSTTQDTCFWAKLEEVKEYLDEVIKESSDAQRRSLLLEKILRFESYANTLVKKKEVSVDVLAKNSSYSVWVGNLREFKFKMGYGNEIEMVVDECDAMET
ncbi:Alpha/Beta hydrolase fold [Arabidopsis suecica]|uniref:Alpha/Beta hydrolase fold n=1 Tax=Arabidopsis suecica TaxID=45249 RepID=A0A8T2A120_ARASU|nr:Alpha/Beta hydrolase fold [Arabidopsis suecica]